MTGRNSFNISVVIRLLFIPVILALTLFAGIRIYESVYDIIMQGFEKKLTALSSTSGSFIDLEIHEVIAAEQNVSGITAGPDGVLFAIRDQHWIVRVEKEGSASLGAVAEAPERSARLTRGPDGFYLLNESGTQIDRVDTTGTISTLFQSDADPFHALTYSHSHNSLFLISQSGVLIRLAENGASVEVGRTEIEEPLDITWSPDGNLLILSSGQTLYELSASDVGLIESIDLYCETDDVATACPQLNSLAYDPVADHYWSVAERLLKVNTDGKIDLDYFTHPGYQDHFSDSYLNYVIPMRNIRESQNLTYLYSFLLNADGETISYILDSSVDDDFTHIGYIDDELDSYDFDQATQILLTGRPYISDIKPWGQWGLLKMGFAPIFDSQQNIGALMGADFNVSAISQVSREALVYLSLSTFFFLIISGIASWYFSRFLTTPLLTLKEDVLTIAAGFFEKPIGKPALADLHPLADLFSDAGQSLNTEINESARDKVDFENKRRLSDLVRIVRKKYPNFSVNGITCTYTFRHPDRLGHFGSYKSDEGMIAVWQLTEPADGLENIRSHQEVLLVADQYIHSGRTLIETADLMIEDSSGLLTNLLLWDTLNDQLLIYAGDPDSILLTDREDNPLTFQQLKKQDSYFLVENGVDRVVLKSADDGSAIQIGKESPEEEYHA